MARTRLEATSSHPPAVAAHRGRLVLAWTGSDHRLNLAVLRRAGGAG